MGRGLIESAVEIICLYGIKVIVAATGLALFRIFVAETCHTSTLVATFTIWTVQVAGVF